MPRWVGVHAVDRPGARAIAEPETVMNSQNHNGMAATGLSGARWRKSRHSNPDGSCLEVALLPDAEGIAVRNSRDPDGPALIYTPAEIEAFLLGAKDGEFDYLIN